jgi:outer membrane autotransporter protein
VSDNVSGYKGQVGGLAIGADKAFSATSRAGIAFAYAHANVDSNSTSAPQSSSIDLYQLIGYDSHDIDPNTELNYQVDIGNNTNHGQPA